MLHLARSCQLSAEDPKTSSRKALPEPAGALKYKTNLSNLRLFWTAVDSLIFGIHIGHVNMQLDQFRPVELISGN
jgi:hypothetical protein